MTRRRKNYFLTGTLTLLGVSLLSGIWVGCGKPDKSRDDGELIPISVKGKARFQSYCLDDAGGTPVYERPIEMYCGASDEIPEVTLLEPLPVVNIFGDCEKGTLTIRPQPGSGVKESTWQLPVRNAQGVVKFDLPDLAYGQVRVSGGGSPECTAQLQVNLYGEMHCSSSPQDRYKPTISLEARYWLNKPVQLPTTTTTTSTSTTTFPIITTTTHPVEGGERPHARIQLRVPADTNWAVAGSCPHPSSCYFYTKTTMKQCQ